MKEEYFISLFKSSAIGDDGAIVGNYIYSKDAFFENVHFKKKWMSYYQVAKKAMLVNISDAVAMNAKPKYILLSVAMPSSITKSEMRELADGFNEVASEFGAEIIGGDTISNSKLDITITIISYTKKPLLRSSMRVGDLVAYTGTLGRSKKDLKRVQNLGKIHKKSKFVDIKLRDKFIELSRRYLSAGMDISDGLFSDLEKLSTSSRCGFNFQSKIPKEIGCSGEEYEMLISFNMRNKKAVLREAKKSRTKVTIFAKATRKRYRNLCKRHHF